MFESMSLMQLAPYLPYTLAILYVYFFPTYLAAVTGHKDVGAIAFTNLLIGWTVGGWFGTIVWALDK